METPLIQNYEGLPENWFPLTAVSVTWKLGYGADAKFIQRWGFPVVPDFSSTVHIATGRTLNSALADLGAIREMPSFHHAMKGYVTLSRVQAAHRLLLVQPFNPMLFKLGPHPFPTLLLQILQGQLPSDGKSLESRCTETQKKNMKTSRCAS